MQWDVRMHFVLRAVVLLATKFLVSGFYFRGESMGLIGDFGGVCTGVCVDVRLLW